jgi:tetratricopeptide (TPR) repeat protein
VTQTVSMKNSASVLALALTAALTLSACATRGTPGAEVGAEPSKYGAYLAGRFASKQRDSEAAAKYFDEALGFDPGNEQLLERLLVSNMSAGDLDAAAENAEALLKTANPAKDNRLARLIRGLKQFRDGNFVEARTTFEGIEGKSLSEVGNRFGAAWSAVGAKQPDDAVRLAQSLLGAQGLEAFAVYHKALIEESLGRNADALKSMALAYKVSKGEILRVAAAYGAMLERSGDTSKAKAVYDAYLTKSPDHPVISQMAANLGKAKSTARTPGEGLAEIYYAIANSLNQDNAVDLSIFYAQISLALNPRDDIAITLLGERLQMAERWDESTEVFRRIPKSSPVYQNAQLQIGANLAKEDKLDEAVRVLSAAAAGGPRDVAVHATIGDAYREKERYAEAEAAYSRAVNLLAKPTERDWVLFYTRGIARERLKRWSEAEADLEKALKLKPDQPLVMNYLAYTWIEHGVNQDKALEMLHKAVDLREDDGYIVDSLGWAYYRRGDFQKAVKYLERAILLEPGEATINDHLGDAYWRVGRKTEAQFQWNHALRLNPEADDKARIERKLSSGLDAVEAEERAKAKPAS